MPKNIAVQSSDGHLLGIVASFRDCDDPAWPGYHDTDEARFATEIQVARKERRYADADDLRRRCGFVVLHAKDETTVVSGFLAEAEYITRKARLFLGRVPESERLQYVTDEWAANIPPRRIVRSQHATIYLPRGSHAA